MASRKGTVQQGEASESDEEYEINQSYFMTNTMVVKEATRPQQRGIVVEGEASESDEEEIDTVRNEMQSAVEAEQQTLTAKATADEHAKRKVKFHYDSFFHRRLRVSNLELRSDIVENTVNIYKEANKKLQSAVFHLNRSQASVQEIFSNVGLISGDLQSLTDVLDQTLSRDFLPTLKMNITETSAAQPVVTT